MDLETIILLNQCIVMITITVVIVVILYSAFRD